MKYLLNYVHTYSNIKSKCNELEVNSVPMTRVCAGRCRHPKRLPQSSFSTLVTNPMKRNHQMFLVAVLPIAEPSFLRMSFVSSWEKAGNLRHHHCRI